MKKLISLMLMFILLLTGCKQETEPPLLPEDDYNIEGERVVLFCDGKEFPISFTVDGAQKIESGTYFYYDLNSHFGREWQDSFYLYDCEKLELMDMKQYGSFGKRDYFATNGNWPLFLNPVHTEYSASNQDQVPANLIAAGERLLEQNKMGEEPLIITDVWLCDMDGDGAEEQFFKASNYSYPTEKPKKGETVTKDEIHAYVFLAYADGDACQLLSGSFRSVMNEHKDEEAASVLAPLTYDEQGNLVTTVLKRRKNCSFVQELKPLICDPDGDKKWSVYIYKESDFGSITLMDFSNGSFIKNYEIIF